MYRMKRNGSSRRLTRFIVTRSSSWSVTRSTPRVSVSSQDAYCRPLFLPTECARGIGPATAASSARVHRWTTLIRSLFRQVHPLQERLVARIVADPFELGCELDSIEKSVFLLIRAVKPLECLV